MGVEPIPSAPQADVPNHVHHGHHKEVRTRECRFGAIRSATCNPHFKQPDQDSNQQPSTFAAEANERRAAANPLVKREAISLSPSSYFVFLVVDLLLDCVGKSVKRKARESNPHHLLVARISSAARQTVSGYLPNLSGPDRGRTDHTDLARIHRLHRHAGPYQQSGIRGQASGNCFCFLSPDSCFLEVTEAGVEPAKSPRPQRDRFACLRTRPSRRGSLREPTN